MKNLFFLLFIFAIIGCAFQKSKREKFKTYFPSRKLQAITEMENGKKNGREELYYENGNLFMVQCFKDDMPVDSFYQYDKDYPNQVLLKGYCTPKTSVTILSDTDNHVFAENDYKAKMIKDGPVKVYFKNGNCAGIGMYRDNKLDGINVTYFFNGNIKKIEHYKVGIMVPPIIEFDSSGNIIKYTPVKE